MNERSDSLLWLLILLLVLFVGPRSQAQTTYYLDAVNGSDANAGTSASLAWKTIAKVNRSTFLPGDKILFRRGQTWREGLMPPSSGTSASSITFGAYGTGNKPLLLGSFDKSLTSDWTNDAGNIWKSVSKFTRYNSDIRNFPDVGNLIFNGGASCGVKRMTSKAQCINQGDFFYSRADSLVYIYSASNPGMFYTHIEIATLFSEASNKDAIVYVYDKDYLIFENLDLRYGGSNGFMGVVGASHYTIQNCNFEWIGGGLFTLADSMRYGNGFTTFNSGTDIMVRYCTFDQIYDAAFTSQGGGESSIFRRHRYHHNLVNRSWYGAEIWHSGASSIVDSILVENNTFTNIGRGWSTTQRSDSVFNNVLYMGTAGGTWTNFYFRNNICFDPYTSNDEYERQVCIFMPSSIPDTTRAHFTFDYNRYYEPSHTMIRWNDVSYTQAQFATFQSATGQEAHGTVGDPLFKSLTDFHLTSSSPCSGAGVNVGLNADLEGNPIRGVTSMGAFEAPVTTPNDVEQHGELPRTEFLAQNYPNPFNPTTSIRYEVSQSAFVSINLYDIVGRLVRTLVNEVKERGSHLVVLDAANLTSGVYYYRMQAGSLVVARSCIVLK